MLRPWRKLFHFSGLIVFIVLWFSREAGLYLLGSGLFFMIFFEFIRPYNSVFNIWLLRYFSPLVRKKEIFLFLGLTWFAAGAFISVLLFERPIAMLSILFLTVGDPAAEFIGKRRGKHRIILKKTAEGLFGFFSISVIVGYAFSYWYAVPIEVVLGGAFVGAVAEALSGELDNLMIPLLSGAVMNLLFHIIV